MDHPDPQTPIGKLLKTSLSAKILELVLLFLAAFIVIKTLVPLAGENLVMRQLVIWIANVVMLSLIWLGVKLRGDQWRDWGLTFGSFTWKEALNVFLLSILVFVLAMVGFMLGSVIMANITGIPQPANMSGSDYLKDNPLMLIITLLGVYFVSSFGEEITYRAFLINRISEMGISPKFQNAIAVILSAIIFGLAHYQWGPMGVAQTTFMGLALGICYVKMRKRIWILILAHGYMDTILMVQMYLASN